MPPLDAPLHSPASVGVFTAADLSLLRRSVAITNTTVLHNVALACPLITLPDGTRWWDTRPALDPRECSPASIDMMGEYLQYALDAGLAARHPTQPHLVRRS